MSISVKSSINKGSLKLFVCGACNCTTMTILKEIRFSPCMNDLGGDGKC